jgi:hypothetical protein
VTFFRSANASTRGEGRLAPDELAALICATEPAPTKASAAWLKLARFGEVATEKGSYRHDANVREVSGVELDYDGGKVAVDDALAALRAAGVEAILYTSPSHAPEAPRWRVLAPLRAAVTGELEPLRQGRSRMLARLNGVLGGVASGESWTLSQAYYFGRIVGREADFRCEYLQGDRIDTRPDLDAGAIGKPEKERKQRGGGEDDVAAIIGGEGLHNSVRDYAWRLARKGLEADEIRAVLVPMIEKAERGPERLAAMIHGGELAGIVESAVRKASQAEPVPLLNPLPPAAAYPVEALGPILGPAAEAIAEIVQVPLSLAGNSVLAAAALAAQPIANVQTQGGDRPLSLYVLTVAESGARKSTADGIAMQPAKDHQRTLERRFDEGRAEYAAAREAHKLREKVAREKAGDSADLLQPALLKLAKEAPREPRKPFVIVRDPTIEGIARSLRDGQYSQGLFNDEGGTVIGGYSLSDESRMRTLAGLNDLWGGAPLNRVRATNDENGTLYGRRVSLHLMAQPGVASTLFAEAIFRDTGFLARCLIAAPESLAGTRLHDEGRAFAFDPFADPRLAHYRDALAALFAMEPITDDDVGGLMPRMLRADESAAMLVAEYNRVETAQRDGGEYSLDRAFASKAVEHACRIAGVLTLVREPMLHSIPRAAMAGAIRLVRFYLSEQIRLSAASTVDESLKRAQQLLDWIAAKRLTRFTRRDVMRNAKRVFRSAPELSKALDQLVRFGWIVHEGRSRYIVPEAALAALHEPDAA